MNIVKYFSFIYFFTKYLHLYFFSKNSYIAKYKNLKLIFNPRSVDPFTFFEIFIEEQYSPKNLKKTTEFDLAVDLGANTGLFSLWAINKLKTKKIIAIEMNKKNSESLNKTIIANSLTNVVNINKAFYNTNTKVGEFDSSKFLNTCYRIDENKKGLLNTITLKDIFEINNGQIIDFLKVDIEGGEKYLLIDENKDLFRKKVKFCVIEAHSKIGCSKNEIINYLKNLDYTVYSKNYINFLSPGFHSSIIMAYNNNL